VTQKTEHCISQGIIAWVFNAIFNNISVI